MLFRKPVRRDKIDGVNVELWVRERALPCTADAMVAPVSTNLKMSFGIAKWVRDATAGMAQKEADAAAPLAPGEAFLTVRGRYRFGHAILAVVSDDQKQVETRWISSAVRNALRMAAEQRAETVMLADMTDDLLRQPVWISEEQRLETCTPICRAMLEGITTDCGVPTVRIWVWRKDLADVWFKALDEMRAPVHA